METLLEAAPSTDEFTPTLIGDRIVRRDFYPPYSNPPISNYRKLWSTLPSAFWSSFRVTPGDGGAVNQLGTNPVSCAAQGFQEVGFGYTFLAAASTDYWFDVTIDAGPATSDGSRNSIELQLLGSSVAPVVVPMTGRFLKTTATLAASLSAGVQYTLLFKSKVSIAVAAGGRAYGEVIVRFPKLTVSYLRPGGGIDLPPRLAPETPDLEAARAALQGDDEGADVLFEQLDYKEIARAGAAGFGSFRDGR